MCFCNTKTTPAAHLAWAFHCPSTPGQHFAGPNQKALRPSGLSAQDASLLDLDRGDFISPWTLDQGEPSCSPEPHDRAAFRPWTPDQAKCSYSPGPHDARGDFALLLDLHRAGPEGVPPSPRVKPGAGSAPSTLATVSPVDQDQGTALDPALRRAVGKER